MNKIKQGQTRWQVVVYEPGKIEGYDHQYVAVVYQAFVTKVVGNSVHYDSGSGFYIAHKDWFSRFEPTFRKALKKAKEEIRQLEIMLGV